MKDFKTCFAAAAALSLAWAAVPASAAPPKNIVLVHGAWVDASGWKPVSREVAAVIEDAARNAEKYAARAQQ